MVNNVCNGKENGKRIISCQLPAGQEDQRQVMCINKGQDIFFIKLRKIIMLHCQNICCRKLI